MTDLKFIALEIREVGESVLSNSQDLFLLLDLKGSNDEETRSKIRHGLNLVENILSILTYLSTLDLEVLDRHEELMIEVGKIKFSCHELQTPLESGNLALYNRKYLGKLLTVLKHSASKIITISYLLEKTYQESDAVEGCTEESDNVCYEDRQMCEQYCSDGFCVEDKAQIAETRDSSCPEYIETFTHSTLTHLENGYTEDEHMPWHVSSDTLNIVSEKQTKKYSIWDLLKIRVSSSKVSGQNRKSENMYYKEENNNRDSLTTSDEFLVGTYSVAELLSVNESVTEHNENRPEATKPSVLNNETEHVNDYNQNGNESESSSTLSAELLVNHSPATIENADATASSSYSESVTTINTEEVVSHFPETDEPTDTTASSSDSESIMTESYGATQYNDETTSYSCSEAYTTETPTTPSYETTTQDMYKLSQDIYQAAQDLSSKSSEISSISSEISSKSSDISSLVSELNNYEDEELSKKIQGISKLTQDINSKTSEISSLTSTMSSLSSDISSASSDIPSADRHHAFRTTPWQKMSSKSDDLITCAQGVVTSAQDILAKVTEVVSASADLKVATTVANMAGQITAKTQRLIAEALSIVSKVIELLSVIDS